MKTLRTSNSRITNFESRLFSCLVGLAFVAANAYSAEPPKSSTLIPDDRRIDWKPGIPGGIPKYPPFASVKDPPYSAKGDGKADDAAAIQKAIEACPAGKAVLLPAGTYRLTSILKISKGIVLRGEGPEKTKLISDAEKEHIIGICNWDQTGTAKILSGFTKGSTAITVDDASKFKNGELLLIDQLNDEELVDINGEEGLCNYASREDGKRAMGQLVQLTAKNGNNLTLGHPLYFTFKENLKTRRRAAPTRRSSAPASRISMLR